MNRSICVFASSSSRIAETYYQAAHTFGTLIGQNNYTLVFGGASVGLMNTLANAVQQAGGRVIGVIPESLHQRGISYNKADKLIVTKDIRERKTVMESLSNAFIALPGGFGTLEEVSEIITLKQLRYHAKPIVFLNTEGFYNSLINFFNGFFEENFVKPEYQSLYHISEKEEDVFLYLDNYSNKVSVDKWY